MSDSQPFLELCGVIGRSRLGDLGSDHPLNFKLHGGEIGVILGGKETSSIFRLIAGLGEIVAGEIRLFGEVAIDKYAREEEILRLRHQIGFGFREKGLIANLTLKDNVDLPAKYHGSYLSGAQRGHYAELALRELGVDESLWDLRPSSISWEIRKKVLLARAVVLAPKVLILDDPSALVASPVIPELLRWLLAKKAGGAAILIGTNDYPFGLALADWVRDPRTGGTTTKYDDFVDPTWIRGAELLVERIKQP